MVLIASNDSRAKKNSKSGEKKEEALQSLRYTIFRLPK